MPNTPIESPEEKEYDIVGSQIKALKNKYEESHKELYAQEEKHILEIKKQGVLRGLPLPQECDGCKLFGTMVVHSFTCPYRGEVRYFISPRPRN